MPSEREKKDQGLEFAVGRGHLLLLDIDNHIDVDIHIHITLRHTSIHTLMNETR